MATTDYLRMGDVFDEITFYYLITSAYTHPLEWYLIHYPGLFEMQHYTSSSFDT